MNLSELESRKADIEKSSSGSVMVRCHNLENLGPGRHAAVLIREEYLQKLIAIAKAAKKYTTIAHHDDVCVWTYRPMTEEPCNCGLDNLVQALKGVEP